MKEIVLIGGGGHCKSVIEVIESSKEYKIAGIVDVEDKEVLGYPYLGSDDDLEKLVKEYSCFHLTIGHMKSPSLRIKLAEKVKSLGGIFPNIIAGSASVSSYAELGEGNVFMQQVIVNADVKIGSFNIINTKSLIEHDSEIGDFNHVSTNVVLNGTCKLGSRNLIGSSTVFYNNVSIENDTLISAGSLIAKSIKEPGIYIAKPTLRKIR